MVKSNYKWLKACHLLTKQYKRNVYNWKCMHFEVVALFYSLFISLLFNNRNCIYVSNMSTVAAPLH